MEKAFLIWIIIWIIIIAISFYSGDKGLLRVSILCVLISGITKIIRAYKNDDPKVEKKEEKEVKDMERFMAECNAYVVKRDRNKGE